MAVAGRPAVAGFGGAPLRPGGEPGAPVTEAAVVNSPRKAAFYEGPR